MFVFFGNSNYADLKEICCFNLEGKDNCSNADKKLVPLYAYVPHRNSFSHPSNVKKSIDTVNHFVLFEEHFFFNEYFLRRIKDAPMVHTPQYPTLTNTLHYRTSRIPTCRYTPLQLYLTCHYTPPP